MIIINPAVLKKYFKVLHKGIFSHYKRILHWCAHGIVLREIQAILKETTRVKILNYFWETSKVIGWNAFVCNLEFENQILSKNGI
jgi:hypothetical protein